jgi:hypothetical protein
MEPVSTTPNPPAESHQAFSPRELASLLILVLVFFLVNFFTADKSPVAWTDEVMYEDPAVNLYQGHGFTSGAWYAQTLDKFWAGNVPLYQFVLCGWLKLFSFSLIAVRSLHYLLVGLAVIIAWAAVRRLGLIRAPSHRLLFCLLVLLGSASTYAYRMARPESLCMLLLASALWAFSLEGRPTRLALLALFGVLLVCTGLQMGPYLFLLCGIFWFVGPRELRLECAVLFAGCVAALGLLFAFYSCHGVWQDFIQSIRLHTVANKGLHVDVITGYGSGLAEKIKSFPGRYGDYSTVALLLAAGLMCWRLGRARLLRNPSPLLFGVLAALIVPAALHFIAVFNLYYSWLAYTPLALGVCAELNRQNLLPPAPRLKPGVLFLLTLACLIGLPRRLAVAAFEWRARSYEPVMNLAAPYVPPDAVVFSEQAAYYAAKQHAATVILPTYFPVIRDEDKARITVAIVRDTSTAKLAHDFGGEWREAAAYAPPPAKSPLPGLHEGLDSRHYHLKVFVRSP